MGGHAHVLRVLCQRACMLISRWDVPIVWWILEDKWALV